MTRTISLIIGIAVTALVVAVPTAFGEGRVGSLQPQPKAYVDANERGVQPSGIESTVGNYVDANERGVQPTGTKSTLSNYVDANERSAQPTTSNNADYVDANQRGTAPAPVVNPRIATGAREVDWPQIGIGFGIGIALALGLLLTLRFTKPQRPLAH